MNEQELLTFANGFTFLAGVSLFFLILIRMVARAIFIVRQRGWKNFLVQRRHIILRRDILLFAAFLLIFGGALVARVFEFSLRDNLAWTLSTDVLGLTALGVWAYIEYFVVEDLTDL